MICAEKGDHREKQRAVAPVSNTFYSSVRNCRVSLLSVEYFGFVPSENYW